MTRTKPSPLSGRRSGSRLGRLLAGMAVSTAAAAVIMARPGSVALALAEPQWPQAALCGLAALALGAGLFLVLDALPEPPVYGAGSSVPRGVLDTIEHETPLAVRPVRWNMLLSSACLGLVSGGYLVVTAPIIMEFLAARGNITGGDTGAWRVAASLPAAAVLLSSATASFRAVRPEVVQGDSP